MNWFWTWGRECFGYREGDELFAYHGLKVGEFHSDEVYGADGRYLGEVMNHDRLITDKSKKTWRQAGFTPVRSGSHGRHGSAGGYGMHGGHEDFPSPDSFK